MTDGNDLCPQVREARRSSCPDNSRTTPDGRALAPAVGSRQRAGRGGDGISFPTDLGRREDLLDSKTLEKYFHFYKLKCVFEFYFEKTSCKMGQNYSKFLGKWCLSWSCFGQVMTVVEPSAYVTQLRPGPGTRCAAPVLMRVRWWGTPPAPHGMGRSSSRPARVLEPGLGFALEKCPFRVAVLSHGPNHREVWWRWGGGVPRRLVT